MSQHGYPYTNGAPNGFSLPTPVLPVGTYSYTPYQNPSYQGVHGQSTPDQMSLHAYNQNRNLIPGLGFGVSQPVDTQLQQKGRVVPQQSSIPPGPTSATQHLPGGLDSIYRLPTIEHDDDDDEGAIGDNELEEGELSEGEVEDIYEPPPLPNKPPTPTKPNQSQVKAAYNEAPPLTSASEPFSKVPDFGKPFVTHDSRNGYTAKAKDSPQQRATGNYQFTSNSSNSPGPPSHVATTARLGPIHPSQAPTLSVAIARKEAQDAILRLWPLNVRFSDYLNEGIDRQVLRTLFEELGLDAGVQSRSPSSTDMSLDVVSDTPMSPVNNGASEAIPAPTIPASSIWPVQVPVPDAIPKPVLDSTPVPKPMPTPLQAFDPSILPKTSHVPVQAPTLALQQTPSETPAVPKDNPAEERKDRIARLLAAKGSKQTATQSRIPAAPVSVTNPISQSAKPDDQSLSSLQISASTKSLSEKSKLLQQKMEALRKAREMQVAKTTSNEDPSTTVPFPVSGNPVSNLTSSSQVLMPTLQKSISMPPSSPIPYHRGSVSPKQPTVLGPHPAAVSPNPPKRPAASDLNDMSDSTAKRPFGQVRRPQPFLIDVSEDEDDAAMDLDSPELETSLLHRPSSPFKIPPLHSFSATPTNAIPRQLSMPGAITTPPVGPAGGLSKNNLEFMNKEIEMMKLRIAEAEARKKAKASRTSSPSGHLWGENTAESSKPVGRSPKKSPMLAVSTTPSETNFLGSPARSVVESPSQALPKLSKLRDAGGPVRSRSRAASERLPIIEAHRKDQLLKLEALRSQIAKMEKDIADSIKEEETLRLEAMDSKLDSDGDDADRMSEDTASQGAAPMETDSEASSDEAESPRNEVAAERDEPHTSNSSSTDESMEIQSSAVLNTITDPQDIATNELVPESNAHSLTTEDGAPDVTDSSTSAMSQGELVEASEGSEPIEADSSSDESSHTDTDEAETTVVHHAKPVEIAEATPVTSSISIGQRESPAASTREDQVIPSTAAAKPNIGAFIPYDSPLQYFHAYRFHPQYQDSVSGGLRSLTYSNKIDVTQQLCPDQLAGSLCPRGTECDFQHFESFEIPDDQILVQLGAYEGDRIPEFIDGLKKLLAEFRVRKVRDFKTISQGILDYRSQFRSDKTKILPLGNVSL